MIEKIFNKGEYIMMPEPTPEQVKLWDEIESSINEENIETTAQFYGLSDELKKHFASVKTAEHIMIIGQKHRLTEKITRQLTRVTSMVLLGETNITEFVKEIQEKCKMEEESARQVARDINQAVFLPVKEELKKIHKRDKWPREEEQSPVAPLETEPKLEGNVVDLKNN